MALENSGTMSIGGSTVGRSINLELSKSATATSGLGDADFRTLADVASGAISMSDFYGASSFAPIDPDGQNWSSFFSVSTGSFDQSPALAFNGSLQGGANRLRTSANAPLVTMNLGAAVTVQQVIVVAEPGYDSTCTVTISGTTYTSSSGSTHTFNVSGSLTQMTVKANGGSGRTYMAGMKINDQLLVDP